MCQIQAIDEFFCGFAPLLFTHNTDFLLAGKMSVCILSEFS